MAYYLKLIGASDYPLMPDCDVFEDLGVERDVCWFPKHRFPAQMRVGDWLVYYAVGGTKTIFAIARVTGDPVKDVRPGERWPHECDVRIQPLTVVPVLDFAPRLMSISFRLAEIELRETSHHDMDKGEFEAAEKALRRAHQRYAVSRPMPRRE